MILFSAFYCGGYVAGRMARFNGVRQGIAVWVWAIVIAIVVGGRQRRARRPVDVLRPAERASRASPSPRATLTIAGIVTAVVVAVVSLGGAILGGVVGVRYHRRVDRVGTDG